MKLPPYFLWTTARHLAGHTLNGEIESVPVPLRSLADHLNRLPTPQGREAAWNGFLASREDRDDIILDLANIEPTGPPPEAPKVIRRANLGDIRKVMSEVQWHWPGWIPASRLWGISGKEGIGKTRFAMDLARRIWNGEDWPDGQAATFPPGTPTLWLCSDGQQDDLVAIAEAYGMPDESVIYNAPADSPYEGTMIDGADAVAWLEESILMYRPALSFIDSLTFATGRDLCQANHVKELMTPLRDVAQRAQASICSLLHVSRDGEALGKRVKGINRTIINLSQPDPDQPDRLHMVITKSIAKKPPALGVTMGDDGSNYDSEPPTAPDSNGLGRPSKARDEAKAFIREALSPSKSKVMVDLRTTFKQKGGSANTFTRAFEDMVKANEITATGGPGTGGQCIIRLTQSELAPDHPF